MFSTLFLVAAVQLCTAAKVDPILKQDDRISPQQLPDEKLFFGDMKLNAKQKDALKNGKNMGGMPNGGNSFAAVKGVNLRWTDGVIPYEIDCSLENLEDAVDSIKKAIAEWEEKTCIRFVKRTNEKYFLRFFRNTHCWGNVGMTSYTSISVGYGCEYQHVMTHEIGHVVGFYHEQNRKDRDDYVTVHWENIGQFKDAFDIVKNTDSLGVPYDYESIMHYPWNAFSSNGKNTMSPKRNLNGKVPYIGLSKADAEQVSRMYNCPAIEKKRAEARARREVREKRDVYDCVDENQYCADWAKAGHCSFSSYVQKYCKMSCGSSVCKGSDCRDNYSECPDWASIGHCTLNTRVARECQLSCNPYCNGTQPQTTKSPPVTNPPKTKAPTTITPAPSQRPNPTDHVTPKPGPKRRFLGKGILCKDYYDRCDGWAKSGECDNNPGWMRRNCMLSCKVTTCDMGIQKPDGQCADPLGLAADGSGNFKIPDSAFYSPANLAPGGGWAAAAKNARLYMADDYNNKRIGAWCAASHDSAKSADGYVQVDLGQQKTISYIATQGRDKYFERIERFKIQYSTDGSNFQTYQLNGKDEIFDGNCDHVTPVLNQFTTPIQARYIRYLPWNWNFPCLRMELYGC